MSQKATTLTGSMLSFRMLKATKNAVLNELTQPGNSFIDCKTAKQEGGIL